MLNEEVTEITAYEGDDRCEHEYGGIRRQCTNDADYLVSFQNDMGELDIKLCTDHKHKLEQ